MSVYIQPLDRIHYSYSVTSDDPIVETIKNENKFPTLANKYNLDFENISLNMYKGLGVHTVLIPIKENDDNYQKYVVAYLTKTNLVRNIKVMSLSNRDSRLAITFGNADETISLTGIYEDGNHIETTILNDNKAQLTGFADCIERGYNELPFILRAICSAACTVFWTGVGLAACAGCLAGLGINC